MELLDSIFIFAYLAAMAGIGIVAYKKNKTSEDFFVAGETLGTFSIAVLWFGGEIGGASIISVSTDAYNYGVSGMWYILIIAFACIVFSLLLTSRVKRLGSRLNVITYPSLIARRYGEGPSNIVVICAFIANLGFLASQFVAMTSMLITITGWSMPVSFVISTVVTVFYSSVGGYRAVVITDTICALLMVGGMFLLGWEIVNLGGGNLKTLLLSLPEIDASLTTPNAGGALPWGLLLSAWLLVGFGTVALPHSSMRCLTYRRSDELHRAMLIGTVVCGLLMIGMTFLGVLARGVLDLPVELIGETTDSVIPYLIANHMSPFWAGLTLVGPLAATLSTVSSLMLNASSALVQDLLRKEGLVPDRPQLLFRLSWGATLAMGLVALLFALRPADIVVWINLIAFGGLETAFLFPLVASLFWRRATGRGALVAVVGGLAAYLWASFANFHPFGAHVVTVGIAVSCVLFVVGSLLTPPESEERLALFFRPTPTKR